MWKRIGLGICCLSLVSSPLLAHDYWLQPKFFRLKLGQVSLVHLYVGDHFQPGVERPFQAKMTPDFRLISAQDVTDLRRRAEDGRKPIATVEPMKPGGYLIAMERDWAVIEMEAAKFNRYLEHEGLREILEERRRAGETEKVGRERYRRYLKALCQVDESADAVYKKRLGHRLEIIPQANPSNPPPGARVSFQVWFDGKPLPDAQVSAYRRVGKETKSQESRTDRDGQVQFALDAPGIWLVRLVHMRRCKPEDAQDWESFWSAYSFQVGAGEQ